MFRRSQRPDADAIEVIIGPRATFSGTLRSDASIRIDGSVDGGEIETPANVIFTETARAECNVIARTVSIRGHVHGIIRAERVELLRGSVVHGALHVKTFFMDDGVQMRAELNIQDASAEASPPPKPPAANAKIPVINPEQDPEG